MRVKSRDSVTDTVDLRNVQCAFSWQHRCLAVGKAFTNNPSLFSDTQCRTHSWDTHATLCRTRPSTPYESDTLASFSDLAGFQPAFCKDSSVRNLFLHEPWDLICLNCPEPPPVQPLCACSALCQVLMIGWGQMSDQMTGQAGCKEDDGGVHCLLHL